MQARMDSSLRAVNFSLRNRTERKKVKSEDELERMVLEVTLVSAREVLKVYCATDQSGSA